MSDLLNKRERERESIFSWYNSLNAIHTHTHTHTHLLQTIQTTQEYECFVYDGATVWKIIHVYIMNFT